jgi:hypothetical protein
MFSEDTITCFYERAQVEAVLPSMKRTGGSEGGKTAASAVRRSAA